MLRVRGGLTSVEPGIIQFHDQRGYQERTAGAPGGMSNATTTRDFPGHDSFTWAVGRPSTEKKMGGRCDWLGRDVRELWGKGYIG